MNPINQTQKPSLTTFYQNPKTDEVYSMICETGANQLVTKCSDCKKIHSAEITRDIILQNPLTPLQLHLTSPRLISEVCVRGLYYELALLEKQLEEANKVLATLPMDWCDYLNYTTQTQDQDLLDDMRTVLEELIEVLAPKQSKIQPGQIPAWTTTIDPEEDPKEESAANANDAKI